MISASAWVMRTSKLRSCTVVAIGLPVAGSHGRSRAWIFFTFSFPFFEKYMVRNFFLQNYTSSIVGDGGRDLQSLQISVFSLQIWIVYRLFGHEDDFKWKNFELQNCRSRRKLQFCINFTSIWVHAKRLQFFNINWKLRSRYETESWIVYRLFDYEDDFKWENFELQSCISRWKL
jgi:hypothetical protein